MTETTAPEPEPNEPPDDVVVEAEYAEGETTDPDGAERDSAAGEDYAGSGF